MSVRIERCVCHGQRFVTLKRLADAQGCRTFDELSDAADACGQTFGQSCGLCRPYVETMLLDGRVVFHEIITAVAGDETSSSP